MTELVFVDKYFMQRLDRWTTDVTPHAKEEMVHDALFAIDEALVATIAHMKAQRDKARPKTTRDQLARLWQTASRALSRLDHDFAEMCQYKALGWVDKKQWERADQLGIDTSIESVQQLRDRLTRTLSLADNYASESAVPPKPEDEKSPWYKTTTGIQFAALLVTVVTGLCVGGWNLYIHLDKKWEAEAAVLATKKAADDAAKKADEEKKRPAQAAQNPAPTATLVRLCYGEKPAECLKRFPGIAFDGHIPCYQTDIKLAEICKTHSDVKTTPQPGIPGNMCGYNITTAMCVKK
ncbi:hypothetical protein V1292_001931 [Bradyrhizobium sp. AZCC 1719]|uniref:hypothetical protein n=1 Tax=Bradyrhizobium sp. AZCC 1719 TaxID=3117028 RepID=UPI002FEF444D